MPLSVLKIPLYCPPLEELAVVLENALKENFHEVEVTVVEGTDLTQAPYGLAAQGLCGSPRIADVGGISNLKPLAREEKLYDVEELARLMELPDAFVVGAGAGPHPYVGVNSELMANMLTGSKGINGSRIAKVDPCNGSCQLEVLPNNEARCALMINIFACQGKSGPVLKIRAKKRTNGLNFVSCLQLAIAEHYQNRTVALGGAFRLVKGSAKCHVMPAFSKVPLYNDNDFDSWLRFYDLPAPMVFLSVLVSSDPGLELRLEHSHGFGENTGGHYHNDTTPETVEYEAYYNTAEQLYRIDRP